MPIEQISPHFTGATTHLELLSLLKEHPLVPVDLMRANPSLRDLLRELRMAGLVDIAREEDLDYARYQVVERGLDALAAATRSSSASACADARGQGGR